MNEDRPQIGDLRPVFDVLVKVVSSFMDILSIVDEILSVRDQILSNAFWAKIIAGDFPQILQMLSENKRNHLP